MKKLSSLVVITSLLILSACDKNELEDFDSSNSKHSQNTVTKKSNEVNQKSSINFTYYSSDNEFINALDSIIMDMGEYEQQYYPSISIIAGLDVKAISNIYSGTNPGSNPEDLYLAAPGCGLTCQIINSLDKPIPCDFYLTLSNPSLGWLDKC